MQNLLEKTRRVNRLLQKSAGHPVDFKEMARVLSELMNANVYVVSRRGKVLGSALIEGFDCAIVLDEVLVSENLPPDYNAKLLKIDETSPNISQEGRDCVFKKGETCMYAGKITTIVPINGGGERLGTLILARFDEDFSSEDLILAELGATVVGMEILRSKSEEVEGEARKKAAVQVAIGTLSYSELEAVQHIFDELEGNEGLLVASKIADRVGITRSVIVNALRKFESAGVIESRSLGMKGTHIKVLNDRLIPELRKLR
ncbi:MAG: GTP-sensing pleiotropic transcriptional regulator CodY [Actinobacteria bacterium]|nr:GTP-sensing pleiotropic transcriptional regulator CodY [Actinomycetota bacterium]